MGDFVLFEEFFHLLGDHISIVRHRDERDFFARFGLLRLFGRLRLFGIIYHNWIIHQGVGKNANYSNASNDDFSANSRLQLPHVTK